MLDRLALLLALSGFCLFLTGCPNDECSTNEDCKVGRVCQKGLCVNPAFNNQSDAGDDASDPDMSDPDMGGQDDLGSDDVGQDTGDDMAQGCPNDCADVVAPECQRVVCDLATNTCVFENLADATSCDDGEFCTVDDTCNAGVCVPGGPNDCDMIPGECQQIACDEATDSCFSEAGADNVACTDASLCEQNSVCSAGVCVGTPVDCAGTVVGQCEVAVCDLADGVCKPQADVDGTPCDDGDLCTVTSTCTAGVCGNATPVDCSGTVVGECEVALCDPTDGVCKPNNEVDGSPCNDPNDLCAVGSTCTGGVCGNGAPRDCSATVVPECEFAACDPLDGVCKGQPDPFQNGVGCTNLFDLCSVNDTCFDGICGGGVPRDCSALDAICASGACNPATGQCVALPSAIGSACNAPDPQCQTGTCDGNQMCVYQPDVNGTVCDDFATCTVGDVCTNGICNGAVDPFCVIYFEEQFETCPPPGWTLASEWECGVPTNVGPPSALTGSQLLGIDLDDDYDANQTYLTSFAQTPPINLGGATAPVLRYMHWVDTEGSVYDGYNVKVSTDGGANFIVISTVQPNYNLTINGESAYGGGIAAWEEVLVDLTAYVGQQVVIRFSFRSDGVIQDPGVYIDDVTVLEGGDIPVSIDNASVDDAIVSVPYSQPLTVTGGSGSGTWSIQAGTNIGWLAINPTTGELTGTPLVANAGPVSVTVRFTDGQNGANFDQQTYNFNVLSAVFFDDIEAACPGNWTLGGDWQCGVPIVGPAAAYSGTQLLATNLAGNYNNNQTYAVATATSGPIALSAGGNALLRFRAWVRTEGSVYDGFNVKASTDGVNFVLLSTVTPAYPLTIGGETAWGGDLQSWNVHTADLSAYAGQNVYVQFSFRSDGSVTYPGVYIDDVSVVE